MRSLEERYGGYTPMRATRFYVPLLLQAFSQSLTYPLVAAIVAHGPLGVSTLTAFAQGQCVMFMIGALGGGLVMTGMVFAKTRAGYRAFVRLNTILMVVLLGVQVLLALPPFHALIFRQFLNLPPELAEIARETLLWGVVMQAAFFLRNVPLAVLFIHRASFEANVATVVRIALTAAAPWFFVRWGWTGALWGLAATTVPCILEFLITWWYARPYVRALSDVPVETGGVKDAVGTFAHDSVRDQFRFTLPLSLGGFLLAASPFGVAAFVGRTADAVAMLAVHYVTIGLANPVSYAAFRMQPVAIQFPPEWPGDRRVIRYALCAGAVLGVLPLLCALPGVSDWYFHVVQNVPAEHVILARRVMLLYALWPVFQCVRGYAEGYAAWLKRPNAILFGQFVHLSVLVFVLAVELWQGVPGWLMAAVGMLCATIATIAAVFGLLKRKPSVT